MVITLHLFAWDVSRVVSYYGRRDSNCRGDEKLYIQDICAYLKADEKLLEAT